MSVLHYEIGGNKGIPVVFLHSLGGCLDQWQAQFKHAKQSNKVITIDLPGHGRSPVREGGALADLAFDVAQTIEALGIERMVLVGHSMGGAVAIKFAGTFPDRLEGLVLADAAGDSTQIPEERMQGLLAAMASPAAEAVLREYWDGILENSADATRHAVLKHLADTPTQTVVAIFNQLVQYNPLADLEKFDGAKLLITTPFTDAPFSLQNLRPDIPHIRMEGTSHWLQMDKPAEFNRHLGRFLSEIN